MAISDCFTIKAIGEVVPRRRYHTRGGKRYKSKQEIQLGSRRGALTAPGIGIQVYQKDLLGGRI